MTPDARAAALARYDAARLDLRALRYDLRHLDDEGEILVAVTELQGAADALRAALAAEPSEVPADREALAARLDQLADEYRAKREALQATAPIAAVAGHGSRETWCRAAASALREKDAHRCTLPASIQEALNSGDGTYKP